MCWVLVPVQGPSPAVASGGHSSSLCAGPPLSRPLPLRSTGSRRAGSVIVAHGPSCSAACGILPDQGSYPCPLHWQADSQPPRHQGSPKGIFLINNLCRVSRDVPFYIPDFVHLYLCFFLISLAKGLSTFFDLVKERTFYFIDFLDVFFSLLFPLWFCYFLLLALGLICSFSSFL